MGAGKTLFAVRQIVPAVMAQQYVITNVELAPNWADRVTRHYWKHRSKAFRRNIAERLEGYYIYETDLARAIRYRVPQPERGEGRALFVWDEGQNDLNNRDWRNDGRAEILKWATQLRKLGFVGFLLSQHADNTDAALRRVCNMHIKLQNQREQHRIMGFRATPWPLFLAYWFPAHLGAGAARVMPHRIDRYFLSWHRHLYDTHGFFHGLDGSGETDAIMLPVGGLRKSLPAQPVGFLAAEGDATVTAISDANRHPNAERPAEAGLSDSSDAILARRAVNDPL